MSARVSRHVKCRIFEWDIDMWCRLKGTKTAYLDYFGTRIGYELCDAHYEYVSAL